MRRLIYILPAGIFLVLVGFFAVGLTKDPQILPSALIDQPAPEFDLPPIEGEAGPGFSTESLREGEVSVVNIFASWCVPCRAEHPLINDLADMGIARVYGLNYKDAPLDARRWLNELGDNYTAIGADRSGRTGIDWGVYGVPETFIVDGKGRIRYKHVGPINPQTMRDIIIPTIEQVKAGQQVKAGDG